MVQNIHTSRIGSHLFARDETALHRNVIARNNKKTWYVSAAQIGLPSASVKMLMHATKN